MDEHESRMKVIIFTGHYQFKGEIALFQGARLTDFLAESSSFIAVTHAEVLDTQGRLIMKASFLNVNRENIEFMLPADQADAA